MVRLFEQISSGMELNTSSSTSIREEMEFGLGGASPRKRRQTLCEGSRGTGTPLTGSTRRSRPPTSRAGTTWSPRLGAPMSNIMPRGKEFAFIGREGVTSGRSGPPSSSSSCPTYPTTLPIRPTPPLKPFPCPPEDVPHPPPLPRPPARMHVSLPTMWGGSRRKKLGNNTLIEKDVRNCGGQGENELAGHSPGVQGGGRHQGHHKHHHGKLPGDGGGGAGWHLTPGGLRRGVVTIYQGVLSINMAVEVPVQEPEEQYKPGRWRGRDSKRKQEAIL
eukprot:TRINITY_DN19680_c0_g1_i1.p1 TRINITY_DN19680_c0_g1~~TRINITY_DN19680_c0_g1_i1.p1  ORF type:complete len:275 (+),score=64.95 TRINITY_DN19680_c0_g1_i1:445-1269(+)